MIIATRLRFIKSRSADSIINYVNNLPYKIEIKGSITYNEKEKKFYLWFILPEEEKLKEAISGDID